MKATFIYALRFSAWWREYRLGDEALRALELGILREPKAGVIMQATGGLRKLRLGGP